MELVALAQPVNRTYGRPMATTQPPPSLDRGAFAAAVASRLDLLADCIRGARGVPGGLDSPAFYLDLADEYVAELRGALTAMRDN